MKIFQYRGPFTSNHSDDIYIAPQVDTTYVHIGIQIPYREPMINLMNQGIPIDIEINNRQYRINDTDVLEFEDTEELSLNIHFLQNLPEESVLDIMYDVKDL